MIRGQEGVRVKVMANGLGVADMSTISPDHAVAVDTLLARRVDIIRGAPTLMHSSASAAGVINVLDNKIPDRMPDDFGGSILTRFNTASDEKLITVGLDTPISQHVTMRLEHMNRHANPYQVPRLNMGNSVIDYLPDSDNRSQVSSIGASYIGDKGFIGMAVSQRDDRYGLVGHNHKFDSCSGHVIDTTSTGVGRAYLNAYPHLMDDKDQVSSLHFHCGSDHDRDPAHSHEHIYGHHHDHTQKGPWVDMTTKTVSLAAELTHPAPTIEKVRLDAAHSRYRHTEYDEGKHIADPATKDKTKFVQGNPVDYANDGLSAKLAVYHRPTDKLGVAWGFDQSIHQTHALIQHNSEHVSNRRPLVENTQANRAFFSMANYNHGNLALQSALRFEKAKNTVHYNMDEIDRQIKAQSAVIRQEIPDLSPRTDTALSYALSAQWQITPATKLDATYSHNERAPTPMELYYHGKHLATNSFLYGNKNLDKEVSDNYELGIRHHGDKFSGKLSGYLNRFDNYIHPENLYKSGNLTMRRFIQSDALIRGLEGEISWQINPQHSATVFGDITRGRLTNFAPIKGRNIYGEPVLTGFEPADECGTEADYEDRAEYEDWCGITETPLLGVDTVARPNRHAPRMSPTRLGFRLDSDYDAWSTMLEYTHVFAQKRTSQSVATHYQRNNPRLQAVDIKEDATDGYHLLNIGADYRNRWAKTDYTLSLRANNLLDEPVYIHNSFLPFVPQMGRNYSVSLKLDF